MIISNIFRISLAPFYMWRLKKTAKKLNKWVKKNEKKQDDDLHPYEKRWFYAVKKLKKITKNGMGVDLEIKGSENIPRGGYWVSANHISNFDGFFMISAFGNKNPISAVSRVGVKYTKLKGFFTGLNAFFIERSNPRATYNTLEMAAAFAKTNNIGMVVFPEGKRSWDGNLLKFNPGQYAFPQKYYLPIIPVTLLGVIEGKRWYLLRRRKITLIIHKPLKPAYHSKLTPLKISEIVKKKIQKDLDDYYNSLSKEEKATHDKYAKKDLEKRTKREQKREIQKKNNKLKKKYL